MAQGAWKIFEFWTHVRIRRQRATFYASRAWRFWKTSIRCPRLPTSLCKKRSFSLNSVFWWKFQIDQIDQKVIHVLTDYGQKCKDAKVSLYFEYFFTFEVSDSGSYETSLFRLLWKREVKYYFAFFWGLMFLKIGKLILARPEKIWKWQK